MGIFKSDTGETDLLTGKRIFHEIDEDKSYPSTKGVTYKQRIALIVYLGRIEANKVVSGAEASKLIAEAKKKTPELSKKQKKLQKNGYKRIADKRDVSLGFNAEK